MASAILSDRSGDGVKVVAGSGGSSFLAYNRETVTERGMVLDGCPKAGWVLVDRASGTVIRPAPCGRNRCPIHGPRKAYATAVAVDMVRPERFVLVTGLVASHEGRRDQRRVFRQHLRRLGYEYECWGVVERHESGDHHGHEWQRGDFIPIETFRRAAVGAGMGEWVGLRQWRRRAGGGLGTLYGVKAVARAASLYGVKGTGTRDGLAGFLDDNGGRYGYWTREFFGQGYLDARKEAMRQVFNSGDGDEADEAGDWYLVRDWVAA